MMPSFNMVCKCSEGDTDKTEAEVDGSNLPLMALTLYHTSLT